MLIWMVRGVIEETKKLLDNLQYYTFCKEGDKRRKEKTTYGDEEEDDVLEEDLERVAKDKTERDEERTNRQHVLDNILAKD